MVKSLIALLVAALFANALAFECTTEEHRPRFHVSPKKNWVNDPNGMVYYDGLYHLFSQHHPYSMVWGPMHWGHAISRDMMTWIELPIALYPDELGTIFSGSAVVDYANTTGFRQSPTDKHPVVAIYTSAGDMQRQSISYSLDGGFTFQKFVGNPVLDNQGTPDFRDPKVIWFEDRWLMVLAVLDRVEFYSSLDLKTWTMESEFGREPREGSHDGVWECPDIMPLNVTVDGTETQLWVLFVSISGGAPAGGAGTQYFIGNLARTQNGIEFQTLPWSQKLWIDFANDNYAGVTFSNDPNDRHIYMGWMANPMYAGDTPNRAHRGQFTLPRELGLRALNSNDFRLTSMPPVETANLRRPDQFADRKVNFTIPVGTRVHLTNDMGFTTPLMELEVNVDLSTNPNFTICAENSVHESTCFGFDGQDWFIDRANSGNTGFHDNFARHSHPVAPREVNDEVTTIRIFLDVTSLEVFADGGLTTMTALHFPTQPFDNFYLTNNAGPVLTVRGYKVWGLQCWYPENEV